MPLPVDPPASALSLRVLILGGYGVFGGRLAELLTDEPRLCLIIAGRSQARAEAFVSHLSGRAKKLAAAFDRDQPLSSQLSALAPDVVVDATGPFQTYGDKPYRVVEAAIEQGAAYFDLSDGAAFVRGVAAYDGQARARGVAALSGVSSFPVLTAAVVRELSGDLARVLTIRAGIAPSPHAVVGENVLRAIASYAGQPVAAILGGRRLLAHPLTETMRMTIAPPGKLPLRSTLFSLVDVPDLVLLADLWPEVETVWIGAGPRPEILHRALIGLAFLVRWKLLTTLLPLAGLFHWVNQRLRWGEHRGGMFVEVRGECQDGRQVVRSWHLNAEGIDGPYIPSMAIEALIRKQLDGTVPEPGARAATRELELADYHRVFAGRKFAVGIRDETTALGQPLYQRVLGSAFRDLPEPIQAMHRLGDSVKTVRGLGTVERGRGPLARIAAAVFGFPPSGRDVPVTVHFLPTAEGEVWERNFAGRRFRSVQSEGKGRFERLVSERFGPFVFGLALVAEDERLQIVVRCWSFLGLPMPSFLGPGGTSYESAEDGRFHFHVEIGHPLFGLIVRYDGWLEPEEG